MRTRLLIASIALVTLTLAGAGAVYAYDRAHAEEIGRSVRIGGVDVSGLAPAQARAKLRRAVLEPLSRPVVVRAHGKRYKLTSHAAGVTVDIDASVRTAMARSRDGNVIARTWRGVRGEAVDADVPLDISYSRPAIARLVRRVRDRIDTPAVDASVDLAHGDVTPKPSREGRRLEARRLKRELQARLLDTGAVKKTVRAHVKAVEPQVTTHQLADRYATVLLVNRSAFRLTLYKHLKPVKTYPIAVGQVGLETPAGLYAIQNKAVNPAWNVPNSPWAGSLAGTTVPGGSPENPLKARWLGIYAGAGIHGTDSDASIGSAASHGCIRMHIPDVIELYDEVPVKTPVYIS
jgi:lipoprotein-anchoring transpeptidase ErfK/SrfK